MQLLADTTHVMRCILCWVLRVVSQLQIERLNLGNCYIKMLLLLLHVAAVQGVNREHLFNFNNYTDLMIVNGFVNKPRFSLPRVKTCPSVY